MLVGGLPSGSQATPTCQSVTDHTHLSVTDHTHLSQGMVLLPLPLLLLQEQKTKSPLDGRNVVFGDGTQVLDVCHRT